MAEKKQKTREEWLTQATNKFKPWFKALAKTNGKDWDIPADLKISVGWPKGNGKSVDNTIGQCFDKAGSIDGKTHHIFISPTLTDPIIVLATHLHEVAHAAVGCKCGHSGDFKTVARGLGLAGKLTATVPGPELLEKLQKMAKQLGPYNHVGLKGIDTNRHPDPKKVKNITFVSTDPEFEGYRCAVRRHNVEEHGAPCDPGGTRMRPLRAELDE